MIQPSQSEKMKIAVLASGGGSNFQALIDGVKAGAMPHVELALLVASKPGIGAIDKATAAGIPHVVMAKRDFSAQADFDAALLAALTDSGAQALVLAGYLGILSAPVVQVFARHIINIHPALIPSFCGKGYHGMHVHTAVIESGAKLSGATVHFVDEGVDTGAILLQEAVAVLPQDTPETLQKKVLALEHRLLPRAVEALAARRVHWHGGKAHIAE